MQPYQLKGFGHSYEVVAAMEINAGVLETYKYNFPGTPACNRNILSLSAEELNLLCIDLIVMSPPCQPFCRAGLQKDTADARTDSFCHLMKILPTVHFKYILMENVKGFETSETHKQFRQCLAACGFECQEFLITPTAVGIPNSRLRYYLIGKKSGLNWTFVVTDNIQSEVPGWSSGQIERTPYWPIVQVERNLWADRRRLLNGSGTLDTASTMSYCVGDIVENFVGTEDASKYSVPHDVLKKYGQAIDIVNAQSTTTCCFTKSYGTFLKGTGSIFRENISSLEFEGSSTLVDGLRFFSSKEVARLMCFPERFRFPPQMSRKQQYKGLGNSINVFVVSLLLSILVSEGI